MATIYFSMAGEGRGHATRVHTLVEELKQRHRMVLFAPAAAFEFLAPLYRDDPAVEVVPIDGILFEYTAGKLDLVKSILAGLMFQFFKAPRQVRELKRRLQNEPPDLIVTDFEPTLPQAAEQLGIPYVSLTHQHVLVAYDLSPLPGWLRRHARFMSLAVYLYYHRQQATIISSFFTSPLRRPWRHAIPLGPMLRREIRNAQPIQGDYLLSYLRENTPETVVAALAHCGHPVRIYGQGERSPLGGATFHRIDPNTFVDDMAGCLAIVAASGNQMCGEALYLGKPILAIPEPTHHEQQINAHFLVEMGCGVLACPESLTVERIHQFVDHLQEFEPGLARVRGRLDGTIDAVRALESLLPAKHASADMPQPAAEAV